MRTVIQYKTFSTNYICFYDTKIGSLAIKNQEKFQQKYFYCLAYRKPTSSPGICQF